MLIPNLMIISGSGNLSGKTTMACRVIDQFAHLGIIAFKITPHFHETTQDLFLLTEQPGYSIFEEINNNENINHLLKLPHVMFHLDDLFGSKTLPFDFRDRKWIYNDPSF
jgi:hypothetical protein